MSDKIREKIPGAFSHLKLLNMQLKKTPIYVSFCIISNNYFEHLCAIKHEPCCEKVAVVRQTTQKSDSQLSCVANGLLFKIKVSFYVFHRRFKNRFKFYEDYLQLYKIPKKRKQLKEGSLNSKITCSYWKDKCIKYYTIKTLSTINTLIALLFFIYFYQTFSH